MKGRQNSEDTPVKNIGLMSIWLANTSRYETKLPDFPYFTFIYNWMHERKKQPNGIFGFLQ